MLLLWFVINLSFFDLWEAAPSNDRPIPTPARADDNYAPADVGIPDLFQFSSVQNLVIVVVANSKSFLLILPTEVKPAAAPMRSTKPEKTRKERHE